MLQKLENLTITFRHVAPSPAIEADIAKHANGLTRFHARIMSCKVVVEGPHQSSGKGGLYRVSIDLRVPGGEIAGAGEGHHWAHEDVHVAIRDAFNSVGRQVQDFAKRASGDPVQEKRSSSLSQRLSGQD